MKKWDRRRRRQEMTICKDEGLLFYSRSERLPYSNCILFVFNDVFAKVSVNVENERYILVQEDSQRKIFSSATISD